MLTNNHIPILHTRFHTLKDLCAPTSLFKHFSFFLTRVNQFLMLPTRKTTSFIWLMEAIVDWDFVGTCCGQDGKDVGDCVGGGEGFGEEGVKFSGGVDKVVVRVY